MKNQFKKRNPFITSNLFFAILLITFVVTVAYSLLYKKTDPVEFLKNNYLNGIFIILMYVILQLDAAKSRRKLNSITENLSILTYKIKSSEKIVKYSAICEDEFLKRYLNEFDNDRKNSGNVAPDIADYINEHTIADFTHKEISDQIANVMTGLGILGTFIGLTFGLQGFNQEQLMESTQHLIEGLKTAFVTSIFGMIASILYNHFYHADLEKNSSALEEFYGAFYEKVANYPEIDFYNKVINYNENEPNKLAKALSSCFSELLIKTINPVTDNLNKSMDSFIERSVEKQSDILKDLVNSFMEKLNRALDDQFYRLARSIEEMCKWQGDFMGTTGTLLDSITAASTTLSQMAVDTQETEKIRMTINNETQELVNNVMSYSQELKSYLGELQEWETQLKEETRKHTESIREIEKYSLESNNRNEAIAGRFENIMEKFNSYGEHVKMELEQNRDITSKIATMLNDLARQLGIYTSENNENLKNNARTFANAIDRLVNLNKSLESNVEFISSQFEVMEQNTRDMVKELHNASRKG